MEPITPMCLFPSNTHESSNFKGVQSTSRTNRTQKPQNTVSFHELRTTALRKSSQLNSFSSSSVHYLAPKQPRLSEAARKTDQIPCAQRKIQDLFAKSASSLYQDKQVVLSQNKPKQTTTLLQLFAHRRIGDPYNNTSSATDTAYELHTTNKIEKNIRSNLNTRKQFLSNSSTINLSQSRKVAFLLAEEQQKQHKRKLKTTNPESNQQVRTSRSITLLSRSRNKSRPLSQKQQNQQAQHKQTSKVKISLAYRNRSLRFDTADPGLLQIPKPLKRFFHDMFNNSEEGCTCHDEDIHTQKGYSGCEWARWAVEWSKPKSTRFIKYYQLSRTRQISPEISAQIDKDVERTQPNIRSFSTARFQQMLRGLLRSYAAYDPETSYVQGMNLIASCIIFHIKNEELSFWFFVKLMEDMHVRQLYLGDNFEGYQRHITQIESLALAHLNDINCHFAKNQVSLRQVGLPWVLSLMSVLVPVYSWHILVREFVLRGWRFLYRVCIFYLASIRQEIVVCRDTAQLLQRLSVSFQRDKDIDPEEWDRIINHASNSNI